MLSLYTSAVAFAPTAPAHSLVTQTRGPVMTTKDELVAFAKECNPVIGYYDPLGLADIELWDNDQEASIAWLRHAEIKHGRIAMAAFVGYIVHNAGVVFPFAGPQSVVPTGLSPPEIWDAIPFLAKLQIIATIGVFEHISEDSRFLAADGMKHYMRGGKPGYMPSFSANVHPCPLTLWDPFGFTKKLSPEAKAKKLVTETNNGRLAMIGFMGFMAESKVPGSVPALSGLIKPYDGDVMAPFLPTGPDSFDLWTVGNVWS